MYKGKLDNKAIMRTDNKSSEGAMDSGSKNYKGRPLGTAIGQKMHNEARKKRTEANTGIASGRTIALGGAATVFANPAAGFALIAAGTFGIHESNKDKAKAVRKAAKASAIEATIAKSRGGSAALGLKGVVPKSRTVDRGAVNRASSGIAEKRAQSQKPASSSPGFVQTHTRRQGTKAVTVSGHERKPK